MGLSTYEKEFLAVLLAITKWKHYLSTQPFGIKTNHESLKYLLEQKITSAIQQKRMIKLMGMDCTIQYKKGKKNVAADALSRRKQETEGESQAITAIIPAWVSEVTESYEENLCVQQIISDWLLNPESQLDYSYVQGILKYKRRIYI